MKKNYYEILQIDKNASPEIIEKAYKTLAKKYHPDLQSDENKQQAGEILKQINEAYEVLSDPTKKEDYDNSLIDDSISKEEFDKIYHENQILKNELNHRQQPNQQSNSNVAQNHNTTSHIPTSNPTPNPSSYPNYAYEQELQNARQQAYHNAYIQDLKNRGYKIKYRKTIKDYLNSFIALIITVFVLFLLWQIPFIRDFLISIYYDNPIIHILVDSILKLFSFAT